MAQETVSIRGRSYPFFPAGGSGMVRLDDEVGPWMAYMARTFPEETNRAIRSAGWWMHKRLKDVTRTGQVPGTSWPRKMPIGKQRKLINALKAAGKGEGRTARRYFFGRLRQAIAYKHEPHLMRVRVGFLSKAAAMRARELQEGTTIQATPRMRKLFWAAGLGLGSGGIDIPPRPLIGPMHRAEEREIVDRIFKRTQRYINKSLQRSRSRAGRSALRLGRVMGRAA